MSGSKSSPAAVDILVECGNPSVLDSTLVNLPGRAALVGGPHNFVMVEDFYVMRVFGNPSFIKFACENQGYCRIVRELDHLV